MLTNSMFVLFLRRLNASLQTTLPHKVLWQKFFPVQPLLGCNEVRGSMFLPRIVVGEPLHPSRVARISASIWLRYFSSAFRPAAVSRYSVFGVRPSNDFAHAMYSASSSFRACPLK